MKKYTLVKYLKRIVEIRKNEIPKLQAEVDGIINRIEPNTYRCALIPGYRITVSRPPVTGYNTNWKNVVEELQSRYNIPADEVRRLARVNRSPHSNGTKKYRVTVAKDTAKDPAKCKGVFL